MIIAVKNVKDFILKRKEFSFIILNFQSLRSHALDLTDIITKNTNILLLSETKMKNDEQFEVPNFFCIAQFQRPGNNAGGVAIYQNKNRVLRITTLQMCFRTSRSQLNDDNAKLSKIGEICASHDSNLYFARH